MTFDFELGGGKLQNAVGLLQVFEPEIQQHVRSFSETRTPVIPFRSVCALAAGGFVEIVYFELKAPPNSAELRKRCRHFIFEQRKAIFRFVYPIVDLSRWHPCTFINDFGASTDKVL
jgi:hypothetical protein